MGSNAGRLATIRLLVKLQGQCHRNACHSGQAVNQGGDSVEALHVLERPYSLANDPPVVGRECQPQAYSLQAVLN